MQFHWMIISRDPELPLHQCFFLLKMSFISQWWMRSPALMLEEERRVSRNSVFIISNDQRKQLYMWLRITPKLLASTSNVSSTTKSYTSGIFASDPPCGFQCSCLVCCDRAMPDMLVDRDWNCGMYTRAGAKTPLPLDKERSARSCGSFLQTSFQSELETRPPIIFILGELDFLGLKQRGGGGVG